MQTILLFAAVLTETALLAYTVLTAMRERSSLARFVRAAVDAERLKDVAMQLPTAYRAPATQFAGELARRGALDEVVAQAVTKASNTTFGLAPVPRAIFGLAVAAILFAPLGAALLEAVESIQDARSTATAIAGPIVFLEVKGRIDPAFGDLHAAFQITAILLAGIIIVGAAHWWLIRPEVREARFVKALIEAAIGARPGASAPVSGRLSQLLAPDRSLGAPVLAFGFFCFALCGAWLALAATAGVKDANAADVYNVWPADNRTPLKSPPGMRVPAFDGGGSPLRPGLATLAIGPERVEVAGEMLVELDGNYGLSEKFPQDAIKLDKALSSFKRGTNEMDVNMLVHADVPMSTVLALLQFMSNAHNVRRAYVIFARDIDVAPNDDTKIPASLFIQLLPPETTQKPLTIQIDAARVTVDPATPMEAVAIDRSEARWRSRLASVVRARALARQTDTSGSWIAVRLDSAAVTYDELVDVLSAADSTCPGAGDCGVPGLGLRFYLER